MKKNIWGFCAILVSLNCSAQDQSAQKYASFINTADSKKHLSILASDEFEGRETGKPGAQKAADYIAGEFKKLGLQAPVNGSYFQNIPLVEPVITVSSFKINQLALSNWKDFYFAGNPTKTSLKATEIVFAGYGISSNTYNDLANTNIENKVVMFINSGEPSKNGVNLANNSTQQSVWSLDRTYKIQQLRAKKPALIIAVSPDVSTYLKRFKGVAPEGRLSIKTKQANLNQVPVINVGTEVADQILKNSGKTIAKLKASIDNSGAPQTQSFKAELSADFGTEIKDVKAVNVLGYLEGTDLKNELLVVSSHYDHIGLATEGSDKVNNGADDDGSGTTGVLDMARAFTEAKKGGNSPRRSILFLTVVGEEKGLLGSEWYSENPVFPLENTVTDLNIDMIGRVDPSHKDNPSYCYLIGSDKLSTELHKISEQANATYTKLAIDYKYNDPKDPERIYYRSDHYNFAKHNIPIIFYFNGVHEDYHKPGDEVSKINFDMLVKRAQLVFYTGWELANRDKRPVVDVSNDMPQSR